MQKSGIFIDLELRTAISPFTKLLEGIDPGSMSSDPDVVSYLSHILDHKKYYLSIYTGVLELAPEGVLLDYGTGNGLLGIFAKYCGWEKVILCDVNDSFLAGARALARALDVSVDGFICGNLQDLGLDAGYVRTLVGTNVVEHIYNIDAFLGAARDLDIHNLVLMTGAHPGNKRKVRDIRRVQAWDERNGYEARRLQIITEAYPELREAASLARLTRGLRKEDILAAAARFAATGNFPAEPGPDTCDPDTGSWTERLLSVDRYRQLFAEAGFGMEVHNGYYNDKEGTLRAYLLHWVNRAIRVAGSKGFRWSAYIILVGRR